MDSKLEQEISRTDPQTPFRATAGHVHSTWAKTFHSRPELYIRPHTVAEVQKVITLARRCRRRIVVVGCGHSPSDLTCTSSWMVNLDHMDKVLKADEKKKTLLVQGGIRLCQLNERAAKLGLTMPNLGSIDVQSLAGAISTATHGSSLRHGLMVESVRSLRIVLSNGQTVTCSAEQNPDLFRAALVSLGALGIIVEVEFQMVPLRNIEWEQTLKPLGDILDRWDKDLWTQKEYTRVWWMPYMKRAIVWSAEKTDKPLRPPEETWYGGSVGFHTYHNLLWLSNYTPWILPWVEWFVFGMQYGFRCNTTTSAVEEQRSGLLMNCLYSQFVNEWALPLHKGPEAISRLSAWINGEEGLGGIPFSSKGLYVHCPIEVRVCDSSTAPKRLGPGYARPLLDNSVPDGPTLYLNATLYRAYLQDPPCRERYYEAFEWLMREMGARPHWAKNFAYTTSDYVGKAFGADGQKWVRMRNEADPEGLFVGEWHRRTLPLGPKFALEEHEVSRHKAKDGGQVWVGSVSDAHGAGSIQEAFVTTPTGIDSEKSKMDSPSASSSGESFDLMHGAEAERSVLYDGNDDDEDDDDEGDDTDRDEARYHGHPKSSMTGTQVFDKM